MFWHNIGCFYTLLVVLTHYWLFWHIGCFQKSGGKLAGGYVELGEEVEPTKKKRKVVTRVVKPTVGSQFRAADTSDVQQVMWNECHTIPYHANHRLIFRNLFSIFHHSEKYYSEVLLFCLIQTTYMVLELHFMWIIYVPKQCIYYQRKELEKTITTILNTQNCQN